MNGFTAMLQDERGAAMIEYALISAFFALAMIGAITTLGNGIQAGLNNLSNQLTGLQKG